MSSFYSCPDTGFVKYVPQWLQHMAIADLARKQGGNISFYAMEDFESLPSQMVIKGKLLERPEVDGFVFFTLRQFLYLGNLNLKFLELLLESGYSVHFARESLSIQNIEELKVQFPLLFATQWVFERDESPEFWKSIDDWLTEQEAEPFLG